MDIQKLIRESETLDRKYDERLSLLRTASYEILKGSKIPYNKKDIEDYLWEVLSAEDGAENIYRMVMTNEQGAIADEMNKVCYQIIKKYGVKDLELRLSFTRLVEYAETDPEKAAELEKEGDALDDEIIKSM